MTAALQALSEPNRRRLCWAAFLLLAATIAGVLGARPTDGIGIAALGAAAGPFTWIVKTYFQVKGEENRALIEKED